MQTKEQAKSAEIISQAYGEETTLYCDNIVKTAMIRENVAGAIVEDGPQRDESGYMVVVAERLDGGILRHENLRQRVESQGQAAFYLHDIYADESETAFDVSINEKTNRLNKRLRNVERLAFDIHEQAITGDNRRATTSDGPIIAEYDDGFRFYVKVNGEKKTVQKCSSWNTAKEFVSGMNVAMLRLNTE